MARAAAAISWPVAFGEALDGCKADGERCSVSPGLRFLLNGEAWACRERPWIISDAGCTAAGPQMKAAKGLPLTGASMDIPHACVLPSVVCQFAIVE